MKTKKISFKKRYVKTPRNKTTKRHTKKQHGPYQKVCMSFFKKYHKITKKKALLMCKNMF